MKRILLVSPSHTDDVLENVKVLSLPPLNLALLASYTPENFEVQIVDESVDRIDFDARVDLVGITCMTALSGRAYEIAAAFRKRGIPVVIGGIHATVRMEEVRPHADAVVTGEAEQVWGRLLADWSDGKLGQLYEGGRVDLEGQRFPRRELVSRSYFVETVQTSRGCPFDCNFCSVTRFNGGKFRLRPVAEVLAEVRGLKGSRFFFVDDNIIGSGQRCTDRARELFEGMAGLGKTWGSQVCITIADDEKLLDAAAASGARFFFVGIESVEAETLAAMNKKINLRRGTGNFKDAIRKIQDRGIAVIGGFIFGNDTDRKDVFERTVEFMDDTGIDGSQLTLLTPSPGTELWDQLSREDRLLFTNFPADWAKYNGFRVVFRPRHMTVEELQEGYVAAYRATSSLGKSVVRGLRTFAKTRSALGALTAFHWNNDCRRIVEGTSARYSREASQAALAGPSEDRSRERTAVSA